MWQLQKNLSCPVFSVSQYLRDFIRTNQLTKPMIDERAEQMSQEIDNRIEQLLVGRNQVIIESRMISKLLPKRDDVITILLKANDTIRSMRYANREHITPEKAFNRLINKEQKLLDSMKAIYNRSDFYDNSRYDVVIDTSEITTDEVLQQVLKLVL